MVLYLWQKKQNFALQQPTFIGEPWWEVSAAKGLLSNLGACLFHLSTIPQKLVVDGKTRISAEIVGIPWRFNGIYSI